MIQFNLNRFGRLLKWTMQQDRAYYRKSFLQLLVVMLLMNIFFLFVANYGNDAQTAFHQSYKVIAGMMMFFVLAAVVLGPCSMFHSMSGKYDRQNLMLMPASNFEKYLVRYMSWILMLPIWIAAMLLADVLQYVMHIVMGYEYYTFIVAEVFRFFESASQHGNSMPQYLWTSLVVLAFWLHSVYALGATFFRSRKFSFVFSTFAWIGVTMFIQWLFPNWTLTEEHLADMYIVGNLVNGVWAIVNFWLSYVIFCRTQAIGKFVNL